jgi:hypothetical protein
MLPLPRPNRGKLIMLLGDIVKKADSTPITIGTSPTPKAGLVGNHAYTVLTTRVDPDGSRM